MAARRSRSKASSAAGAQQNITIKDVEEAAADAAARTLEVLRRADRSPGSATSEPERAGDIGLGENAVIQALHNTGMKSTNDKFVFDISAGIGLHGLANMVGAYGQGLLQLLNHSRQLDNATMRVINDAVTHQSDMNGRGRSHHDNWEMQSRQTAKDVITDARLAVIAENAAARAFSSLDKDTLVNAIVAGVVAEIVKSAQRSEGD